MFHHLAIPQAERSGLHNNPFLKRAALFGGALLLLFVAFQLLPSSTSDPAHLYSDTSGTVATKPQVAAPSNGSGSTFRLGYIVAFALLAGGGAFALYLRKRTGTYGPSHAPIRTVGTMQLAPGQQLRLVSCGAEVLLLGVTSSQITLLKVIPADEFEDATGPELPAGDPIRPSIDYRPADSATNGSFATLLQQFSAVSPQTASPQTRLESR